MSALQPPEAALKWATMRKIDPECWEQVGTGGQGFPIWELKADWLRVMFKGAYVAVRAVAGQGMRPIQAVCFQSADGTFDLRVYSRLKPGEYYDSSWRFLGANGVELPEYVGHAGRRRLEVRLTDGESFTAPANVIWMVDPARLGPQLGPQDFHVRVFCSAIDETIDINAATLDVGYQENVQEQQMKVLPWQRYLFWLMNLRNLDKAAYNRIKKPVRRWLETADAQARVQRLSEYDIPPLIQQGILPAYLAWLSPPEAQQVVDSIRVQQGLGQRKDLLQQYSMMLQLPNFNPIPRVLLQLDLSRLDIVDLQILMTIGALRELHGFVEVQTQMLMQRRPDLQAAQQSPQGTRLLQADPEIAALNADPRAVAEQQDQQDLLQRRAGNYGPTNREMMIAMQVISSIQQQQLTATLLGAGSFAMLMGMNAADQYMTAALAEALPWKLYKPYIC